MTDRQESRDIITSFKIKDCREKTVTLVELFQWTAVEHGLFDCFYVHSKGVEEGYGELGGEVRFGAPATKIVGRVDLKEGTFTAFHVDFTGPGSGLMYPMLTAVLGKVFYELDALVVWDGGESGVVELNVYRGEVTEEEV